MARKSRRTRERGQHGRRPARGRARMVRLYLGGLAIAVLVVAALIGLEFASRGGGVGPNAELVVPEPRSAAMPAEGMVLGSPDAPVTIVEYADFQ